MTFAQAERKDLCDLFDQVGDKVPTLCEGWTSHDLAAHLWIRETDPLGAPGIVAKPLSGLTDRRMNEVKERWPFTELVDRVRNGPPRFSVFAIPGLDEGANTTEFFIHHEDVRRAGVEPQPPRDLGADTEDWMWRRLKLLARAWFRRCPVGVVLERVPNFDPETDPEQPAEPDTVRAAAGADTVTIVARPSELMLYSNGRRATAEVQLIGEEESLRRLSGADFGV
ncbi:MAG: TIGR03085 family metal-binding protein [Propionibacteriaceae bacterium]